MEVIMLFKNNFRPAVATAGGQAYGNEAYRGCDGKNITLMSADGDDFGNFSSGSADKRASAPKKRPISPPPEKKKSSDSKRFNIAPFIIAGVVIIALVLIIAIFVSIFSAPKSSLQAEDTVYFTYVDSDGKYRVNVNGSDVKQAFENEITLTPSADNSFAYILEKVDSDESGNSGTRMYILRDKKLSVSEGLASSCIAMAKLKPGIIYKYNKTIYRFTGDTDTPIIRDESASNFIISDDAATVVYTSAKQIDGNDVNVLKYFKDSGSDDLCTGFKPLALSPDGRYIYGTSESNGRLYYIDADAKEIAPKSITKSEYGDFGEITEMNADGSEIVFYTNTSNGAHSFVCNVAKKSLTQLGKGIFRSVSSDPSAVRVNTFVGSYFTAQNATITVDDESEEIEIDEDGDISTYRLTKKGPVKVVDAEGKFSPDGKYFYYIDDNDQLVRIGLSSTDYAKNKKVISGYVSDFEVTQKGDVYMFSSTGDNEDEPVFLYYYDTSKQKQDRISAFADPNSMNICANTLYFSETTSTSDGDSTVIYTSTDGSAKAPAEFKSVELSKAPTMQMGTGKNGYAYVSDDSGATMLFFTANGKKFDLVSDDCTLPDRSNNPLG